MVETVAQRAAPPKAGERRPPAVVALDRLAKLAAQGVTPPRMVGAINDILADWRIEQVPPFFMRERIVALKADVETGIQAAEDFASDTDDPIAKLALERQFAALQAVRKALAVELEAIG